MTLTIIPANTGGTLEDAVAIARRATEILTERGYEHRVEAALTANDWRQQIAWQSDIDANAVTVIYSIFDHAIGSAMEMHDYNAERRDHEQRENAQAAYEYDIGA